MNRYMYVQGNCLDSSSGIADMLTACQQWHVTDIMALKVNRALITSATAVGVRVHRWWCVNYDPSKASNAAAVIAANPGIAGISLDYFRDHTGSAAKGGTPARWTAALDTIRAATQAAGVELSLAGVPYDTSATAKYNFTTVGCCQTWDAWLAAGKLDRVLVMEYLTLASFQEALPRYEPLRAYRDRIHHIAAIAAYAENDQSLSVADYAQWLDLALEWSGIGVFDYSAVAGAAAGYGNALAARGGEVEPEQEPETITLHYAGPVTIVITG